MNKLFSFFCILAAPTFAQPGQLDSLKRQLRRVENYPTGYVADTLRCSTIKAIMRAYVDVNIDSSVHYNQLLIKLCQKPALHNELIFAYQHAGYLHRVRGDDHQSILFLYKALTLAEKHRNYAHMASSYSRLALAYTNLEDLNKATTMCRRGLAVLHQHPDPVIQLSILNAFGAIYRGQHKPADALTVNQTMYALARREHNAWYEAQSLHSIGWDYMEMGDTDKPLSYYRQALVLARKLRRTDLEGSILLHMTELYRRRNEWREAISYCQQVRQTASHLKNSSLLAEANEKLYQIYRQTGESANALTAYEAFVSLRNSLSKEKAEQRIEALQAQYDNVQKTIALQQQQSRNQQLAQTQNKLLIGAGVVFLIASLLVGNIRRLQAKNRKINQQRVLLEKAQAQLADANATLETRVQDRTEALVQANRELTRKNEEIKAALFKGQTIERKRVALELHDNLSSLLSAVNMSMQSINPRNLSESEQLIYRNLKQLIQNAYAEVRNISHNILPAELEKEGLVPTLTHLIARLNQSSPLLFTLSVTDFRQRLPIEIEFNAYSIVLELINNAMKHAQASGVTISLHRTEAGLQLTVIDDGIGLGPQQTKRGVGLQNIQARLDSLGGTFTIPATDTGTRIDIAIPIDTVGIDGNVV